MVVANTSAGTAPRAGGAPDVPSEVPPVVPDVPQGPGPVRVLTIPHTVFVAFADKHRRIAERLRIAAHPYGVRVFGVGRGESDPVTGEIPDEGRELFPEGMGRYEGVLLVRLSPDVALDPDSLMSHRELRDRKVLAVWKSPSIPAPTDKAWNLVIDEEDDPEDRSELYKVSRRLAHGLGLSGRAVWWRRLIADFKLAGPVQRVVAVSSLLGFLMGVVGLIYNIRSDMPRPLTPMVEMSWSADPALPFDRNAPLPRAGTLKSGAKSEMHVRLGKGPGSPYKVYLAVTTKGGKAEVARLKPPWTQVWDVGLEQPGPTTILVFTTMGPVLSEEAERDLEVELAAIGKGAELPRQGNRVWAGDVTAFERSDPGAGDRGALIEVGELLPSESWANSMRDALLGVHPSVRFSGQSFQVDP